jgi:hypothetical protein
VPLGRRLFCNRATNPICQELQREWRLPVISLLNRDPDDEKQSGRTDSARYWLAHYRARQQQGSPLREGAVAAVVGRLQLAVAAYRPLSRPPLAVIQGDAHREIDGAQVFGNGANRDVVEADGAIGGEVVTGNVARCLQFGASGGDCHRCA